MDSVPKDPYILLSFINMKLRDKYRNLDILCEDLYLEKSQLENNLRTIGYDYDDKTNQFKISSTFHG